MEEEIIERWVLDIAIPVEKKEHKGSQELLS
jgi:hypothetical protein